MDRVCLPKDPKLQTKILNAMGLGKYFKHVLDVLHIRYILLEVILIAFGLGLIFTLLMRFIGHLLVWILIITL